jgi:exo-1,4-beta-D-glucosaminidase
MNEGIMPPARQLCLCLVSFLLFPALAIGATVTPLHEGWRLQSACKIQASPESIASPGFSVDGWLTTTVPNTVVAAQVAAGLYPDPYFDMNLRKIPGEEYPIGRNFMRNPMPAGSPYRCGWWYRTEFTAPAASRNRDHFWLHFNGINYRGSVWINGHQIAGPEKVAGTYRTYDFEVTDLLQPGRPNVLAVETFAPQEHDLGVNWMDQAPTPPDKNMGLQGAVELIAAGAVTVRSPMVATHFIDGSLNTADLTVYADLSNATDKAVSGVVTGSAAGAKFRQPVQLAPHESRTVELTAAEFPQLRIHNPPIWWPRQMGEPHLEELTVGYLLDGQLTDEQTVKFGIREMSSELSAESGGRLFRVNGKSILIRGGAWTQDLLLREDNRRLRDQFDLVANMGLNSIRLEGKLEPEEFFRLADERGILIMAGWACCQNWENWEDWKPEDLQIASESLRSQMLRLRSHASLFVWLNGSDHAPPPNVESEYLKVEAETHWPNPILASAGTRSGVAGPTGFKMNGPYDYVPPNYWYVDRQYGGAFGFNTETGPGEDMPSLASRKKFLSNPEVWPPDQAWTYHNAGGKFATLQIFDAAMEQIYGKPASSAEYVRIAQTMAYDSERAMFEAFNKNKYFASGVIQHMLNNAWPAMVWNLYDYYLNAGAGYFGTQRACEPLHIQYSFDDHSIVVVNSTYQRADGLHAELHVHNVAWKELYSGKYTADAAPDSSQIVAVLPATLYAGADKLLLVDLTLENAVNEIVSRNFYWVPAATTEFDWSRSTPHGAAVTHFEDLTALRTLPPAQVHAHASIHNTPKGREISLRLENPSPALAFQIRSAVETQTGDFIAPVLWSDNWIELVPGESRTLTALLPANFAGSPVIHVDGWNFQAQTLSPVSDEGH